ncbi:MAG: TIGR01212 family radical SAM protein [Deltaproteobacteria bacterium]|nr:TIGR01212 family radical SAM protein [Deltaproteobacteria bacterium]
MNRLYYPLSEYLKGLFGCKVFKVTINAGFTCPNRDGTKGRGGCIYCESSMLVPKDHDGGIDVKSQLDTGIERVRKRHKAEKFIAYFQINTNTHAPVEYLRKVYSESLRPEVVGVAVSTRPDCVNDDIIWLFSELKEKTRLWVELGLQTANDRTLEVINRGHTAKEFEDAVVRLASSGIEVCAHVIVGLPGEGKAEVLNTIDFVSKLPLRGIKFHQLQVIKGTRLEEMYLNGEAKVLSLDEYASIVVECLEILPPDLVIHRLSGDTPKSFLVAPKWGANKFMIAERIVGLLKDRKTFQGARFRKA